MTIALLNLEQRVFNQQSLIPPQLDLLWRIEHVLELLTWLAQRFGRPIEQGTLIDLPLTHQQLAETISTTRVTVTRLLEQLEQAGLIWRIRRRIVLLSDRDRALSA